MTTTLEIGDAFRRSAAGSESTAWVAIAQMSAAPFSWSSSAAAQMVLAVSIMSSISTQWRPFDLAHHVAGDHGVGAARVGRVLCTNARSAPRCWL